MDLYYPRGAGDAARLPAVLIAIGYRDPAGRFRSLGWTVSWARLIAASGMVAVLYANEEPAADARALFRHVSAEAAGLGIDERRIGVLASSGSVPVALDLCMREPAVACAALCYGFMLAPAGEGRIAEAAVTYGFADATAGRSVTDLRPDLPLFVVRAGLDEFAGLNDAIDRFAADALRANLPVTVVNHAGAPHAFDLVDDSDASRHVVGQVLEFLRFSLRDRA